MKCQYYTFKLLVVVMFLGDDYTDMLDFVGAPSVAQSPKEIVFSHK